jgi:phosphomannomutase
MIDKTDQLARAIELINILRDNSQTLKASTGNILENNDFERAEDEIADDFTEENDNLLQQETDNTYNHLELNKSIIDRIKLLNEKQKNIFNKVKNKLISNNGQFFQIIHGAGGTGKSFLAEIIKDLVILFEHSENNPNNNLHVVISAPTGVAAKNIKGQ